MEANKIYNQTLLNYYSDCSKTSYSEMLLHAVFGGLISFAAGKLISPKNFEDWFAEDGSKVGLHNLLDESLRNELDRSQDEKQLNSLIEPATDRARESATQWIVWAKNNFPEIPVYVIVPGDGGLIIDWKTQSGFVSVSFDEDDSEMDTIFSKLNGIKESFDFSKNKLYELLSALNAYDTVSSDIITMNTDSSNYERRKVSYTIDATYSTTDDFRENVGQRRGNSLYCFST